MTISGDPATSTGPRADLHELPGWYGKLSPLGDFAQRRLPADWVQACDAWLSAVMSESRQRLGERWLDVYLTAPLQRFDWAPGVVDSAWWFGVLMPSCDKVGRYFPLLIAQPRSQPPTDRIALDHLDLWYEHLARTAMQTLHEAASLEAFEAELEAAPPWPVPARLLAVQAQPLGLGERYAFAAAAPLSQWLPALAAQDLLNRLAGCTLWWRMSEADSEATATLMHGLPDAGSFIDLLSSG